MKELSIEEKAKAYDEAIKRLEDIKTGKCQKTFMFTEGLFDYIFPELKESENWIPKEIIKYLKEKGDLRSCWIAWLEKQGEKTSDKIVEKARTEKQRVLLTETDGSANIDWDCRSLDDVKILLKCGLEFIRTIEANKQMLTDNRFGGCSFRVPTRYDKGIKQGEQKPAIEMKSAEESLGIDSETYNKIVDECIYGEQKPTWSEEDEKILNYLLWFYDTRFRWNDTCGDDIKFGDIVTFLKSLKDRYIWKPIESDIRNLEQVIDGTANPINYHATLHAILEKLKKLRKE